MLALPTGDRFMPVSWLVGMPNMERMVAGFDGVWRERGGPEGAGS